MLGICVVYLVPDEVGEFLLRTNLHQLRAHTEGQHRIYGAALRLPDASAQVLVQAGVRLPQLPAFDLAGYERNSKGAGEHSHYLDQLVDHAFADGCSHVATFDMDSWPVARGWDTYYARLLAPAVPVVAMQRVETNDDFPNPAFTLIDRGFWREGRSSFAGFNPRTPFPLKDWAFSRPQSGAGILAELRANAQRFLPLLRTNLWNPHPVMCGIYDHRIFHFGAGSRAPTFGCDKDEYATIDTDISRSFVASVNAAKRAFFARQLKASPDEFLRQLAHGVRASAVGNAARKP